MKPTPQQVKAARIVANLTQKQCAEIFGYALRSWQQKEASGATHRDLSQGEWHYLQLLAGEHPEFVLVKKIVDNTFK